MWSKMFFVQERPLSTMSYDYCRFNKRFYDRIYIIYVFRTNLRIVLPDLQNEYHSLVRGFKKMDDCWSTEENNEKVYESVCKRRIEVVVIGSVENWFTKTGENSEICTDLLDWSCKKVLNRKGYNAFNEKIRMKPHGRKMICLAAVRRMFQPE